MQHCKVASDTGLRVPGNSSARSRQHFLSLFCCCLEKMLKSSNLPLWLKSQCQCCPQHSFAQLQC